MTSGQHTPPLHLEVRNVCAGYGATQVLRDVNLAVRRGGVTTLLGANGAGKTTTLRVISGLLKPASGQVLIDGQPVTGLSPHAIASRRVGHVPDGRGTLAELSVEENLRVGGYLIRSRRELQAQMEAMFGFFPVLKQRQHQQAGTLSGGEQQMLAIARALMPRPSLLLLDEPSFGIAPLVVQLIFRILRDIITAHGLSILLIEQNASLALGFSDDAYLLESGRITLHGPASALAQDDAVRRAYLGAEA
ncbi:ABC transporter ATP-binding protein [Ramlibacter tataouinensis]|uniref:ABC transporter ATP-binding protein n=1 Tax=Ramlibacter tataouinensis TaxID=94132 RepID=UPI0022F392B4|nr:ABC transporter ATP-binding protein [Ramlibacter tataouinensis]WBY03081.1 ABC transporter ATP-binding protein [Ramlibacter tataouinensis]